MPPKRVSRPRRAAPVLPAPPATSPAPAPLVGLPRPKGAWRVFSYILSVLQPVVGLVLALLYWSSDEAPLRRFSRVCLVLAILGWAVSGGLEAFQSGLQSGEWFIQPY